MEFLIYLTNNKQELIFEITIKIHILICLPQKKIKLRIRTLGRNSLVGDKIIVHFFAIDEKENLKFL